MTKIKVASFNCENLFMRYRFSSKLSDKKKAEAVKNGFIIDPFMFQRITDEEKAITAKAIKETGADIIGLMEVENMDTLKNFCTQFLKEYKYKALIDGNDPRLIDVALISKIPFDNIVTHQTMKLPGQSMPVFSRDCLEVNFTISGKPFAVFVNHFKSMHDKKAKTSAEGRANTAPKRKSQCKAILEILKKKYSGSPANHQWIVLGDLNDYNDEKTSLKELYQSPWMVNLLEKELPQGENWTHYWDSAKVPVAERYKQIDYLFPSKSLYLKLIGKPEIVRKGIITKAKKYHGPRFPGVTDKIGASDHCPIAATFNL
jgi:endonuclease/exonuclease/phosphatase family metal-dependent hydrolase